MPKSDLRIDMLGTSFSISAAEESVYLESLLTHFRSAVEDTQKQTGLQDPLKIAILTGFLLCDELHKKNKTDLEQNESREAEKLLWDMIVRVDKVLEDAG
ncbi:MAG: cell division protein ZapA [Spirochaetaceae bacterium]|jgi:cell division protein ZapA (FtsZ GTPase activity inhibitor)|nr:cell division protein ZapA [Spirochaetaceae bacterium]